MHWSQGENVHYSCENKSPVSRHSYSMHVVESAPGTLWSPDNWCVRQWLSRRPLACLSVRPSDVCLQMMWCECDLAALHGASTPPSFLCAGVGQGSDGVGPCCWSRQFQVQEVL